MGIRFERDTDRHEIPKSSEKVISPNNQLAVTFTELGSENIDKTIRAKLHMVEDQRFIASLGKAQYAEFSPDSSLVLTISPDGKARLFNNNGELLRRFKVPEKVRDAKFIEKEGSLMLVLNQQVTWAIQNFGIKEMTNHQAPVLRVAFSGGNSEEPLILTSTQRAVARLWKMTGELVAELSHPVSNKQLNTTFSRFSPDGQFFVTWADFTAEDGYPKMVLRVEKAVVRLWNRHGELQKLEHEDVLLDVIISPDSQNILTFPADAAPVLWSKDGERLQEFQPGRYYYSAAFVPGQPLILMANNLTIIKKGWAGELWNFKGDLVRTFQREGKLVNGSAYKDAYASYPVFSPDRVFFLSYDVSNPHTFVAYLWHFKEGKVLHQFEHESRIFTAEFSPDKKQHILTASADGTARLWNLQGQHLQTFEHEGPVYNARFSPDGQLIVTASADGTAKLWDLEGHLLADLNKHAGEVYSAAFSPDGRYICTGCEDGTARLWPTPFAIKNWMDGKLDDL
jgi:WD40 repeat protein